METTTKANLTVIMALLIIATASHTVAAYTNHTVGGAAGWFFNSTTNTSATNYSSWAAAQDIQSRRLSQYSVLFYLTFNSQQPNGALLLFKGTTNQTVIQTYNDTTYKSCTMDDMSNDTFSYDGGSSEFDQAMTVAVPLTSEGPNYYFSDAEDGVQCEQGMAFEIVVSHGQGLPPSLNQPPPPPYAEPPSANTAQAPPVATPVDQQKPNGAVVTGVANMRVMVCMLLSMLM
ncbi:hypothetical protein L1049_017876 [Liquidambar formosana]|uniref:Phytocyanin domain-containing protein n=1 Tax=Liquidambar formosana TaxID=63359 RepID=A0AAP0NMI6_LIQFO